MTSSIQDPPQRDHPLVMHARVISGKGGGPEKTILNSPRFLNPLGYDSVCVYLRDPADPGYATLEKRAAEKNAPLESIDDFGMTDFGILARTREIVEKYRPEIWHGHDYKSNLLGLWMRRHHPMKLVTTVHGWVQKTWKTPAFYFIDRQCLKRYDHVVCVSRDLHQDCLRLGVPPESLSLVDNAIALDDYDDGPDRETSRTHFGLSDGGFVLAAVGRLSAEKGFDLLIQSTVDGINQGRNLHLIIAGDGAIRDDLQSQIDASGHGDRIRLLGFVEDPRAVYAAADAYVLSSHREGLPNVVLEAMAMRVPVIATNIAGMPDLIQSADQGIIIPPGNVDAITGAVAELIDDAELAKRLRHAGRERVEQKFSFEARMQKIAATYQ